jgi:hypothetical protein
MGINTEALIDASTEIGLKINVEKTKYMLLKSGETCIISFVICTLHQV